MNAQEAISALDVVVLNGDNRPDARGRAADALNRIEQLFDAQISRIARLERILRSVDVRLHDVAVPMTNVPAGDYPDLADLTLAIRETAQHEPTHYMIPAATFRQICAVIVAATAINPEDINRD